MSARKTLTQSLEELEAENPAVKEAADAVRDVVERHAFRKELGLDKTWALLGCGHFLLWDDPDEDVSASFYCPKCGGYFRVESFSEGAS